jgi:hypothetical protein
MFVAFCIVASCLLVFAGTVSAYKAGYQHTIYAQVDAVTIDGSWTSSTEWADCNPTNFGKSMFGDKYLFVSMSQVNQYDLIECLTDTTNDSTDFVQVCLCGLANGGSAPQTDDYLINITGHGTSAAVKWYQGTGSGWAAMATPGSSTFQYASTLNSSPFSSTPHWIYEIMIEKTALGLSPEYWFRVATYDASNAAAGVQAWPPTSQNVPDDWGDLPYSTGAFPENLSLGVMIAVSSVAVVAGSIWLRKRPKITNLSPARLWKQTARLPQEQQNRAATKKIKMPYFA